MAGIFVIFIIVLALVIGSVIPAFVSKILMSAMFKRRVSFGLILLAMVIGAIFTVAAYVGLVWLSKGTLDPQVLQDVESSMTPAGGVLITLFGFMLQVLILTFIVPDQNMELIAAWRWAVVFALQYVVIILIVIAAVFLMNSLGFIPTFESANMAAPTSQILTRVV